MKFINRTTELEYLNETKTLSKNKFFSLAIWGLRRVGKTKLVLEFINKKELYFFVNKDKTSNGLLKEYEEILKNQNILTSLEHLNNWDTFFNILFERYQGVVVFDEFQNFSDVEKAIYGILQKQIDLNEDKKNLLFIFLGSATGLMNKLFKDTKEPLYGRLKRQMNLKPLSFENTTKMCNELTISDLKECVKLYSVFGGYPKYYVAIEDENIKERTFDKIIDKFFFDENALFENEVMSILSLEFGKRTGIYYEILSAIANGCTKISEIASNTRKKESDISRQLNELVHYFAIVGVEKQAIGNKKIYTITHPLMYFWFRFFYKNLSAYKRRDLAFISVAKEKLNTHIGNQFEKVCAEFILKNNILPFKTNNLNRQWGKIKNAPKGKNTYEIDIVALNDETKDILFVECKWKTLTTTEAKTIIEELKQKATYVVWNNNDRNEHYCIIAKKIKNKQQLKQTGIIAYDLDDF